MIILNGTLKINVRLVRVTLDYLTKKVSYWVLNVLLDANKESTRDTPCALYQFYGLPI